VTASTQNKLSTLIAAMKVYQHLYDNTDLVLSTAHRISIQARATLRDRPITGWEDILSQDPRAYIRFMITMEVALSKGVFPQESDLPFTSLGAEAEEVNEAHGQGASRAPSPQDKGKRGEMQYSCLPISFTAQSSPIAAPPGNHSRGIIMPAVLDAEADEFDEEGALSKPYNENGSVEPFLMDPDSLLQSMLGSYIAESNASAEIVGLPWGSGTLFEV
jgi:hypothetical protein